MVYIFFVQPGDMTTFDKEISIMQSVEDLKDKISEKIGIPKEQQVLLISGGESLDSKKNLCSYMAGTDTNPIYLFSTNYDVSNLEVLQNLHYNDKDIKQKLIDSMRLPVSLDTVTIRTQLAVEYHEVAKKQLEFCESMVHEQHLQQQGWSAVIANLDDIISEFKKRWELFLKGYGEFMTERKTYYDILSHFQEDKDVLMRVPVIDILLEMQKDPMESSKLSELTNTSQEIDSKEITLYEWISSSDNKNSLEKLHEECLTKLEKFEVDIMPSLQKHVYETLQSAETPERKEIEGLGKRLFDLEELLRKIKKYVEHQSDMAQAFQQNRNSASQAKDLSILPDLCTTHERQLDYIKQYHQKLMDDRARVIKAKHELSKSLCARIGWVQNIENKLWELDSHLVYFHECLQRMRKHIEVFQQVHLAPITYVNSVVEVVRRRAFSQLFLLWASDLACQQLTIYNEELTRRKEFNAQFEGHFLNALFPGMSDVPPAFAIEAPAMFDAKLPDITQEDIDKLKKDLPDFSENLILPDMDHVTNFFLGKNASKETDKEKVDDAKAVEEKLIQAVSDVGLASNLDKNLLKATGSETCLVTAHALQATKYDCESEMDNDEFEKVVQSPLELTFPQEMSSNDNSVLKIKEKQDLFRSIEVINQVLPPKKPPRSFHRVAQSFDIDPLQRTLSISTNESFTNIKNISLDSIDELSSMKNFSNTSESYFNSHYNQTTSRDQFNFLTSTSSLHLSEATSLSNILKSTITSHHGTSSLMLSRSKSVSPQSPREGIFQDNASPIMGHQPDFVNDEFYIDESLPSSVGTGNSQGSEFVRQLDTANIVVAMLQDNLQISRSEHEKVKAILRNVSVLAKQDMDHLRDDLRKLTTYFLVQSEEFTNIHGNLSTSWRNLIDGVAKNEKEIADVLLKEHETEKDNFRYNLLEKDEIISKLEKDKKVIEERNEEISREVRFLEEKISKLMLENAKTVESLKNEIREKELEKDKMIKEVSDKLKFDHKTEIDNIKSRFKLMTMERSPSLTSLEKDKSGELSSLPSNTTLLAQMQDNFEMDKEKAIVEEQKRYEKILAEKIKELQEQHKEEIQTVKQNVAKRITDEKDKQIDLLRERDWNLSLEITKLKMTIQQLAESQQQPLDLNLNIAIDDLKKEKENLQEELRKIKAEKENLMTASVSVCEEKLDASTSPLEATLPYDLSKSEISPRQHRLNIGTCRAGDFVLVLWDEEHANFKILQESKHIYFLHSDSLEALGLSIVDKVPNKFHCTGEVVDKEYCHARKNPQLCQFCECTGFISESDGTQSVMAQDEIIDQTIYNTIYVKSSGNRYKVPKGTKFFRVKVQPIDGSHHGRSMSASHSTISTFEPVLEESQIVTADVKQGDVDKVKVALDSVLVEQPEEIKPASVEKNFAEDSGIVENVEQAIAAIEGIDKLKDDRSVAYNAVMVRKASARSTNWLETMFRSMFSKKTE